MGTSLNTVPITERELNELLQGYYTDAKERYDNRKSCNYTGLLEIITSEPNIVTAIHKIKANKGSETPGVDKKVMKDYLQKGYDEIIQEIRNLIYNYQSEDVRRVWIPKPGKKQKRPLGIPTIKDRIAQECVRKVIEPIAEAQFFEHSYGFRPMRSADMAITRIKRINYTSKCYWAVEGDIKGFFDNIDHNTMIRCLWRIGIRDKRVLCIVKQMLKAGVMNECKVSELGTPQGGIISPLLANIYLNEFDKFITKDFERKKLKKEHSRRDGELTAMRNHSNLKTCYYIRYADDWVILTDSKESAEKLKFEAKRFLKEKLKLELSEEKTLITNVLSKPITFLGVKIRMRRKDGKLVNEVSPDMDRFEKKMNNLKREVFLLRKTSTTDKERLVQNIIRVNAIIVGLINYYSICDQISPIVRKYSWKIKYTGYKSLKKYGGQWVRANQTANLIGLHEGHEAHIPAIKYKDIWIGLTDLNFAKWTNPPPKNQNENPFTPEGRELYNKRMRKKSVGERADEMNRSEHAFYLRMQKHPLYNFEFFMNRAYAYKRDKGKCKICGGYVLPYEAETHHINPRLPKEMVNKVPNLATMHEYCHTLVHSDKVEENLTDKTRKKLAKYRKKLEQSQKSKDKS